MAGVFGQFLQGHSYGNQLAQQRAQEQKQSQLGSLLSQAYGAPGADRQGLIQQAIAVDPQAGMNAGAALDKRGAERLGQMASVFVSMTPEQRAQAWPGMRGELAQIVPGAQYPDMWDESFLPQAQTIAQQLGGAGSTAPAGYQEFNMLARDANLSPEDRALAARRQLYLDPRPSNAAIKYEVVTGSDGVPRVVAMDPREVGAQVVGSGQSYGSGVQSPSEPRQGGEMFAGLSAIPGLQITSGQRSPQHNAEVGGVPNSYHLTGQARDIAPPRSPEQAQQVRQYAAQNGLEIIDEGDHWHLEPAPGAGRQGGVNPFAGRREEDEAAAVELARGRAGLQLAPQQAQADAYREGLVTQSRESATTDAKRAADRREKETAFATFDAAMDELDRAMGETVTGPIAGMIPAVTADQQTADGAVAAMAPILKQLFRSAGEGVFTDRDQALLIQMLPTRTDHPEARRNKIANVRRIVQAKLQSAQQAAPSRGDAAPSNDIDGLLGKYGIR